jgi:UPF0755 protein
MRKNALSIFILLIAIALFFCWEIFGSTTHFSESKKNVFIKTGSTFRDVLSELEQKEVISSPGIFSFIAKKIHYANAVRPGKYTIESGSSIFSIIKQLRSGKQSPVNLVITKLRTKEDLIEKISENFECDSVALTDLLNNNDSLREFKVDTNTVMTLVIPNTYSLLWTTPPMKILKRLYNEKEKFWTGERKDKAAKLNLSPVEVYTLASIVEEETNVNQDKGKIASVYLNRLKTGMKLSADPTVKFALKNFELKRIFTIHTSYASPYNTYQHTGLPPGPICSPSATTIDAVLNAPATSYMYFVAQPNLTGYSNFSSSYEEHLKFAKLYQQWIAEYLQQKNEKH